jgi:hypothetical protein
MGTRQGLQGALALMLIPVLCGCGVPRYVGFAGDLAGEAEVAPKGKSIILPSTGLSLAIENEARVEYWGPDAAPPQGPLVLRVSNEGSHTLRILARGLAVGFLIERKGLTAAEAIADYRVGAQFPEDMPAEGILLGPGATAVIHFGESTHYPTYLMIQYKCDEADAQTILRLWL